MISLENYGRKVHDSEGERASNSYLMSVVAIVAGLPIPIINLIATFIFYLGNLKSTDYVRWHATQALFSQITLVIFNSIGFWWTFTIVTETGDVTNQYIAYIIVVVLYNITEFVVTIYSAIKTRKGEHVKWWFYGDISDVIVAKENVVQLPKKGFR